MVWYAYLIIGIAILYLVIITSLLWNGDIGPNSSNSVGPIGPIGPVGPAGPAGPPEFTRYIFVSKSGDDSNDGLSWSSSLLTLTQALIITPDSWHILVGAGTYDSKQELIVDKNITIRSAEGKDVTTLTRDIASVDKYRILSLRSAGAICTGFTIENGETATDSGDAIDTDGGNVYIDNNARLIDCKVKNGNAFQYGGNVYIQDGFVTRCEISHGSTRIVTGGYGGGLYIRNTGVADTCYIHHNVTGLGGGITLPAESTDATVINCTVTQNEATGWSGLYGGGLAVNGQGVVRNNIIWGNTGDGGITDNVLIVSNANPYPDFRNNCYPSIHNISGVVVGIGNIMTDPELLPSGQIPLSSPCVGTGYQALTPIGINGTPRVSMTTPSMGAFVPI